MTARVNGQETPLSGFISGPAWYPGVVRQPFKGSIRGESREAELEVQPGAVSDGLAGSELLVPATTIVSSPYKPLSRSHQSFASLSSLGAVSALLRGPVLFEDVQRAESSPLFGFEQGSILFSNLLRELTK